MSQITINKRDKIVFNTRRYVVDLIGLVLSIRLVVVLFQWIVYLVDLIYFDQIHLIYLVWEFKLNLSKLR